MPVPPHPALTLAIEIANPGTSGLGEVALGEVFTANPSATLTLATETLREVDRDRDDLIPSIERLLARVGRAMSDLRAVAVSVGPGGFTSTRVACATGAMLAEGLGIPAIPVPSALAAVMARSDSTPTGSAAVLMATKGASAWCAVVPLAAPHPAPARSGRMMTAPEIIATGAVLALADHHLPADIRTALTAAGIPIQPLSFSAEACLRAAALCEPADPSALLPIYPREPEAVTLWRARHGGGAMAP